MMRVLTGRGKPPRWASTGPACSDWKSWAHQERHHSLKLSAPPTPTRPPPVYTGQERPAHPPRNYGPASHPAGDTNSQSKPGPVRNNFLHNWSYRIKRSLTIRHPGDKLVQEKTAKRKTSAVKLTCIFLFSSFLLRTLREPLQDKPASRLRRALQLVSLTM